jgi:hypothetical protein
MAKIDLGALYRQATAVPTADAERLLDAETLARLAAGERVGDHVLAALGESALHATALQIALDAAPVPAAEPETRVPRRLIALAASIAVGFIVLVMNGPRVHQAPDDGLAQGRADDRITVRDFEDGVASADSANADEIFKAADDSGV